MKEENVDVMIIDHDFQLSPEEMMETARQMADLDAREDDLNLEKKQVMTDWNTKISDVQTKRKRLAKVFRDGYETRSVECTVDRDYKAGRIVFRDAETGDILEDREMLPTERQMNLFEGTKE